eukprot:TRINITY_DN2054_c0_g1_i1.p2 TRINITY_DN2054_c0_g1~~TRINITY_DN2054_c0_g1_i1.p2  ORF type:complete len:195 (-),score=73.80 TRINITY_DN2054_c0_g1_i1:53-577(-)
MPVYHADDKYNDFETICGFVKVPIKTKFKGPCIVQRDDGKDFIDEAIYYFRANCLFRNFEIKANGDRLLIYLTLFINQCVGKVGNQNKDGALRVLNTFAMENFLIPGDSGFVLNAFVTPPANRAEADLVKQFLTQLRQETASRLCDELFRADPANPSKWWTAFAKRKFLNKELK